MLQSVLQPELFWMRVCTLVQSCDPVSKLYCFALISESTFWWLTSNRCTANLNSTSRSKLFKNPVAFFFLISCWWISTLYCYVRYVSSNFSNSANNSSSCYSRRRYVAGGGEHVAQRYFCWRHFNWRELGRRRSLMSRPTDKPLFTSQIELRKWARIKYTFCKWSHQNLMQCPSQFYLTLTSFLI